MLKVIGSAVAGYVVMFISVMILMTLSWFILGADGAFKPGVWEVTGLWLFLMIASAAIAAVAGGYTASAISSDDRVPKVLIAVVVVMGVLSALPLILGSVPTPPLPRPDELPMMEAMTNGIQPLWIALLNPLVGAAGVLAGSRLQSERTA